jgi:hypothetical protein
MTGLLLHTDALLRGPPGPEPQAQSARNLGRLLAFLVCGGLLYGAVMGTFGGLSGPRLWQVVFSASKVPLLLLGTFLISLPSFFVLNTLLGVRGDFGAVLRVLVAAQAGLTLVLAALAPYTAFWYVSCEDYRLAILFNGAMFAVASLAGQWHLRRSYRPLIARHPRHRVLLRIWLVLYVFVGIQMGWILRPFVGDPSLPPQFLREGAWGNAYVVVARMLWGVLSR